MNPLTLEDIALAHEGATPTMYGTADNPVSTLTVTGKPPTSPVLGPGGGSGGPTGPGSGGGGGSHSALGNAFAHAHVTIQTPSDPYQQAELAKVEDLLASIYDKAAAAPNTEIALGNGNYITASQVVTDLTHVTIAITNDYATVGSTGAHNNYGGTTPDGYTHPGSPTNPVIGINPDDSNIQTYNSTVQGSDYVPLHELGHAIDQLQGLDSTDETLANRGGNSLAEFINVPDYASPPYGMAGV